MSLTSTRIRDGQDVFGMHPVCIRDFACDNSYPTGGYALAGSNFGFGNKPLDGVICIGGDADASLYEAFYDNVNKKLVISSAGAEVVNGSDLSALTFRLLGICRG